MTLVTIEELDQRGRYELVKCMFPLARMKAEELDGVHGLYNYFMRRVEKIVLAKDKRMYGWEEIGRASLSPSATIQSWHGLGPGQAAAMRSR